MAAVENPSGAHTDTLVTDNEDGTYAVSYTPFEEGKHTLSVKFGGDHIPGSPFKVSLRFRTSKHKKGYVTLFSLEKQIVPLESTAQ